MATSNGPQLRIVKGGPAVGGEAAAEGVVEAKAQSQQPQAGVPSLAEGSTGLLVQALKDNLKRWGFDPGVDRGATPEFDSRTREAVEGLQRKLGVTPSGSLDVPTRTAIRTDLASPNSILKANEKLFSLGEIVDPKVDAASTVLATSASKPASPLFVLGILGAVAWLLSQMKSGPETYLAVDMGEMEEDDLFDGELEPIAPPKAKKKRKKKAKAKAPAAVAAGETGAKDKSKEKEEIEEPPVDEADAEVKDEAEAEAEKDA